MFNLNCFTRSKDEKTFTSNLAWRQNCRRFSPLHHNEEELKEYQDKIDREKSNRAIAKKERAKFNEFKRYSFRRWMATQDGSK